ncbi:MAG: class I SAM-dependent methyltransferase, partial [Myxococcota bacterium]
MSEQLDEHQEALIHRVAMEALWTEPIMDVALERLPAPESSTVLVAEARCGYVPSFWASRLPQSTRVIALDPSRAMLDQARQRIERSELDRQIFFVPQQVNALSYADEVFVATVCFSGMNTLAQARDGLSELVRVTQSGGSLTFAVPLWESFPEAFDMFDEAFEAHRLPETRERLARFRRSFLSEGDVLGLVREFVLHDVSFERLSWEVAYNTGRELLMSPLLRETFFTQWLAHIPPEEYEAVLRYVADAVDTYFHERTFTCTVEVL